MENPKLARKIRELRLRRAWSQSHLAEVSGVSVRTVQRLERRGICSGETLLSIAGAFDVDVERLTALLAPDTEQRAPLEPMARDRALLALRAIGRDVEADPRDTGSGLRFSLHHWFSRRKREWQQLMAAAGAVLLTLPVSFFLTGVLKYSLGINAIPDPFALFYTSAGMLRVWNVVSPLLFLGSMLLALGLNLLPFLDLDLDLAGGKRGFFSRVRYHGSGWNRAVVIISLAVLCGMAGYVAVEHIAGYAVRAYLN